MAKPKILVVEDNKIQSKIIQDCLSQNGYDVIAVENGMAAFKAAKGGSVDLILLDRVLPDMDGSQVCRWLKLDQKSRDIPVIMLTAKAEMSDRVSGLEAGADDYLPKPFDETELTARITARLRAKEQQDELKARNRQLEDKLTRVESLAITDPLTSLFNRRRFESVLANELKRAVRYRHQLSLMFIDLDRFKDVNDTFGHQTGDIVLKQAAQIIRKSVREVDTAARWGGEEFVVLSPNTTTENALRIAERIRSSFEAYVFDGLEGRRLTTCVGVAGTSPSIDTQDKLINAADMALYEAKNNGRNRVEVAPAK